MTNRDNKDRIVLVHIIHNICLAGTELNVIKQVNALDPQRFRSIIVSLADKPATAANLIAPHIEVHTVPKAPGFQRYIIHELVKLFKAFKPDIVYSHNWTTFFYSVVSAKWAGVPIILHGEHGREEFAYNSNWRRRGACRLLSRWCDRITVVSKDIIDIVEKVWRVPGWKIEFVPNGIDLKRYAPVSNVVQARKKLGLPPQKLLIGSIIGKVRPVKDIPTLLRAFHKIIQEIPDAELLLVGQGLDEKQIQQLVAELNLKETVHLWSHRSDVSPIYPVLDIYVNCSVYEGMSNSILEAQACGLPVVATAVGGTPTIIQDGLNGVLVPPTAPEKMADSILKLARDPALRAALGSNARRYVEQNFSFHDVLRRFESLYTELCHQTTNGSSFSGKVVVATGLITKWRDAGPAIQISRKKPIFVFNYHRVLPDTKARDYLFSPMVTAESVFERQLKFFRKHCHVVTAAEAMELIFHPERPRFKRTVLITFDDGYRDFFVHAFPLLQSLELPSMLFVVVEAIGNRKGMWFDRLADLLSQVDICKLNGHWPVPVALKPELESICQADSEFSRKLSMRRFVRKLTTLPQKQAEVLVTYLEHEVKARANPSYGSLTHEFLNWEELQTLAGHERVVIGSHGLKHQRMDLLPGQELEREIIHSKSVLEAQLKQPVIYFSYPWGAYNQPTIEIVARAGYQAAFSLGDVPHRNLKSRFEIERIDSGFLQVNGKFDEQYMWGAVSEMTYRLRTLKTKIHA